MDYNLVPIGSTIRATRKYNGLKQKELGAMLGFTPNTAETRIGQYEIESRFASEKLTKRLAEALGIHKCAISKLSVNSELEALHTLLKIDTFYELEWHKNGDTICFSFSKKFEMINKNLKRVYAARLLLDSGDISDEDYLFIKNSSGIMSDSPKYGCPKRR